MKKDTIRDISPGPWTMWTSNSWRRIGDANDRLICEPVNQNDGCGDLHFNNGGFEGPDAQHMVATPWLALLVRAFVAGWQLIRDDDENGTHWTLVTEDEMIWWNGRIIDADRETYLKVESALNRHRFQVGEKAK